MDRISLTGQQRAAVATIVDWYRNRRARQQVARVWGYAGVGKSTILRYVIEELGLDPMARDGDTAGGVLFAAFTGKAALVMTRKGTPASTIHSLIYRVSEATPEEIARVETELANLRRTRPRMG
ncbi:AAA family ATPase, partial [Rubritepida flocculans]|uniref:AAA family ATPase n=1 Tax=Rubritepida flocculans TaxID=182403 RepID=UPI00048053F3